MGRAASVFKALGLSGSAPRSTTPLSKKADRPTSPKVAKRASKMQIKAEIPVTVQIHAEPDVTNVIKVHEIQPTEKTASYPPFAPSPALLQLDTLSSSQSESSGAGSSRSSSIGGDDEEEADSDLDNYPQYPPMTSWSASDISTRSPAIKVRDFAYPSSSAPAQEIIPESFDAHLALAEYEIHVQEDPRVSAIDGKTLHRLLELGYITDAEAKERWKRCDWNAYLTYRARGNFYPYRVVQNMPLPAKRKDRERIVKARAAQVAYADRSKESAARRQRANTMRAQSRSEPASPLRQCFSVENDVLGDATGLARVQKAGSAASLPLRDAAVRSTTPTPAGVSTSPFPTTLRNNALRVRAQTLCPLTSNPL
ncbi:hypothetical protein CYLTODRAFT_490188 [Cylindrobasidium torrendii FP15055 ss-10]|uniref:Uncharacterized protein n=1 Tax=Cylindrobasidium torrendii FP15055 ss-10 TaxID=1314674 RepID=A0A0D7BEC1_9AGAR|nr:hypothetical protein CYLTODRAFT_490188 [Cylindrobasidium torrendii FP15055 ss-10]